MQEKSKYYVTSRTEIDNSHPKRNFIREHVLVAEQKLGRRLNDGETVHHIDGNKKNNNPNNLIVFASNSDHISCHHGHEIYEVNGIWYAKPKIEICEWCKKEFIKPKGRKPAEHTYCSKKCAEAARINKSRKPSKQELLELLISENGNFTKISHMFNVVDNTVRKWCKSYNMPSHSSDYKQGALV